MSDGAALKYGSLVAVLAVGVAVAVWYVNGLFKERAAAEDDVRSGAAARRAERPVEKPSAPPLDRSTARADEVLVVVEAAPAATRPTDVRRRVVVRGNGELSRLPTAADEPGPLVTALLDRAEVDDLLRFVVALPATTESRTLTATATLRSGAVARAATPEQLARVLSATGRGVRRNAAPEALRLRVRTSTRPAKDLPQWPLREDPATFFEDAKPTADRARFAALVAALRPGAAFAFEDDAFEVVALDVLPPP